MDIGKIQRSFYTIPAGAPFARILAESLLDQTRNDPESLGDIRLLLPTRRACRVMRETFLRITEGQPLLLPYIQPLGDVDEQDLSLNLVDENAFETILNLPPAMSSLERQIILAKLILAREGGVHNYQNALSLAQSLGQFLDQIIIEGLNFSDLHTLVPEDFAAHWQITLDFLQILGENWPNILNERGMIDAAARRNKLMSLLSTHWAETEPDYPIIAAGSTGSIPATARLMNVISALPHGQVVLPGFDLHLDDQSWESLEASHPQYGFKQLFDNIELSRDSVKLYPYCSLDHDSKSRLVLAREMMRPSKVSEHWCNLDDLPKRNVQDIEKSIESIKICHCDTPHQEALVIAMTLRETLEISQKTAAFITPDRNLAKQVMALCRRWDLNVDDSGGVSLEQTQLGRFIVLSLKTYLQDFSPLSLLCLLKHPLCALQMDPVLYKNCVKDLELQHLRGLKPAPGLETLLTRCEENSELHVFLQKLAQVYAGLWTSGMDDQGQVYVSFKSAIQAHIKLLEDLADLEEMEACDRLWSGESGEQAAQFFTTLMEHAHLVGDVSLEQYIQIIETLMSSVSVRSHYGAHPRLMILGQLEARMVEADVVILGGLNEGIWPPDPGHDPWMSRPMRSEFGLPDAQRSLGLSAHDFIQGFCSPNVLITRSMRRDGAPTVPARWLQRLDTVLDAMSIDKNVLRHVPQLQWARGLDKPQSVRPIERPAPKPPIALRPKKLSVTKIETWMQDPYALYASHILKLKPLEDLEKQVDMAEQGTILHNVLERFIVTYPGQLPDRSEALEILQIYAHEEFARLEQDMNDWRYWEPRFEKIMSWYFDHETSWREQNLPYKTELRGEVAIRTINGNILDLSGIGDRIDKSKFGGYSIIDYKSGGSFTQSNIKSGDLPQLGLEAYILRHGGFASIEAGNAVSSLGYWVLNGGNPAGKIIQIDNDKNDIDHLMKSIGEGLERYIDAYQNEDTPYLSVPRAGKEMRFSDYTHLARIKEWSVQDDSGEEAA